MTIPAALELARKIAEVAEGWNGRFFYDGERGDLAYIAAKCERKACDCEPSYNAAGDIDCSVSLGSLEKVYDSMEPLAAMLDAAGPLARALLAMHEEIERMRVAAEQALASPTAAVHVGNGRGAMGHNSACALFCHLATKETP